ncbi:MAG: formimidoylglutamate deiminase [Deltaproteobacteria bacterium]
MRALLPDLILTPGGLRRGVALVVADDGTVASLGEPPAGVPVERLTGKALLPGLVNGHSHAFQRVLRGRTEQRASDGDDFWSWRTQMYRAANALTPGEIHDASALCYLEMLLCGITAVGEFHYLHQAPSGGRAADPNEGALAAVEAALGLGLRITLLRVAYDRAGPGLAALPEQRRFCDGSIEAYLTACEGLGQALRGRPLATFGLAPHSVRALGRDWFGPLRDFAAARKLPLHLHLAEQPKEVLGCVGEHGLRPVELALREGLLGERFTAVHAIHLSPGEILALGQSQSHVCACPTTERNLGDGVLPAGELLRAGARLCLGTDGQSEVNLLEDARELDYHLRLTELRRAPLAEPGAGRSALGARLLSFATEGGAHALGLPTGTLAPGRPADLFTVDLSDPSIAGAVAGAGADDDLVPTIVFGLSRRAIKDVAVQGRFVVRDGRHERQDEIVRAFARVQERLWRS